MNRVINELLDFIITEIDDAKNIIELPDTELNNLNQPDRKHWRDYHKTMNRIKIILLNNESSIDKIFNLINQAKKSNHKCIVKVILPEYSKIEYTSGTAEAYRFTLQTLVENCILFNYSSLITSENNEQAINKFLIIYAKSPYAFTTNHFQMMREQRQLFFPGPVLPTVGRSMENIDISDEVNWL